MTITTVLHVWTLDMRTRTSSHFRTHLLWMKLASMKSWKLPVLLKTHVLVALRQLVLLFSSPSGI